MSVKIAINSPLKMTELISYNGIEFWDTMIFPPILRSDDDVNYTVSDGDRIDRVAYKFYGDPVLWWYIAVANDMELLPTELVPGMVLRIPPVANLATYIGAARVL